MNRAQKFRLSSLMALIRQLVTILCGFILPAYILQTYGSAINGLVSSITQFLAFITLLEMGIGPVIQSNLYKPLAQGDMEQVSKIIASSIKFFHRIAYIFIGYIVFLFFCYPLLVQNSFDWLFSASLILIISLGTLTQYYFGISFSFLLSADQRNYVPLAIQTAVIALNTLSGVILMKAGASIHVVQLAMAFIFMLRPLVLTLYVKKRYVIDEKITYDVEPIKQKWNGFAQHFAAVVTANADVVILTTFSTLENVSIYAIYALAVNGMTSVVVSFTTGLSSMWGNMLARDQLDTLKKSFAQAEFVTHFAVTWAFATTAALIVPFVMVYTRNISDADYYAPLFAQIFTAAYGIRCLRIPYLCITHAAGHYKETQNGAFIQMILNLVLSLALVKHFGLAGVAIGTFAAMAYHTFYFAHYLEKTLLNRDIKIFLKYLAVDTLTAALIYFALQNVQLSDVTYQAWFILAVKASVIALGISVLVNLIFFRKYVINFWEFISAKLKAITQRLC